MNNFELRCHAKDCNQPLGLDVVVLRVRLYFEDGTSITKSVENESLYHSLACMHRVIGRAKKDPQLRFEDDALVDKGMNNYILEGIIVDNFQVKI